MGMWASVILSFGTEVHIRDRPQATYAIAKYQGSQQTSPVSAKIQTEAAKVHFYPLNAW